MIIMNKEITKEPYDDNVRRNYKDPYDENERRNYKKP